MGFDPYDPTYDPDVLPPLDDPVRDPDDAEQVNQPDPPGPDEGWE
jgi:hypothetical protein